MEDMTYRIKQIGLHSFYMHPENVDQCIQEINGIVTRLIYDITLILKNVIELLITIGILNETIIILLSPETLKLKSVRKLIVGLSPDLISVDEGHAASEW